MTDLLGSQTASSPVQPVAGSTATASTGPGTGGTFPQTAMGGNSPLDKYLPSAQTILAGMTPGTFSSDYGVSSSQMPTFLDSTGKLNGAAAEWVAYHLMSQPDRQNLQDILATAGLMKPADANGLIGMASNDAYRSLVGVAASQGASVDYMITQINQGGIGAVQEQIQGQLATAQRNATQPIVATVTSPTTLSADITSAFETALGYSPDQKQIQSFISQVQGQETTYAEAPRTEAAAMAAQAHSEESALNKLGLDGVDTVIQAYQAAVSGTKMPGAGTVQGPVNGATATPGQPEGSPLQPGTVPDFTSQGIGSATLQGSTQTTQQQVPPGLWAQFTNSLMHGVLPGPGSSTPDATKTTTTHTMRGVPTQPGMGAAGSTPTYGGLFALSAADWKKAQSIYSPASKYATPGAAPQSVQLAAFSSLLTNQYDANGGSWSKAVASIASGSPFGTAEGTHLSAFGNSVAAEVNNQIAAIQNEVNNSSVTTKVSQPDAVAEANLAAKQSDPSSYEAAQIGSWGSVLNKMLSGSPSMYNQSSSDTFTGPVSAQAMTSAQAAAPTTVGAGAP
jgi:hypothetical protein